ncbi:hypothetical protein [Kutzneria buriramensis]|uniref:Uncharacterized protein n=1 Tax=Kutzneria buriramensis TaxID=1045776 RepID=A0A3E0GWW8_9PSEU|nr:hypothetical protein [Kutzneria buriramensis]REH31165.1 hypothetical protein BCF44_122188 [Kutzneria buriramensis]
MECSTTKVPAVRVPHIVEPGRESLGRMLASLEQEITRSGWDQPPRLFTLDRLSDREVGIRPLVAPEASVDPELLLSVAAEDFATPPYRHALPSVLGPSYFGLLISFEGWARVGANVETTDPDRPLADQVGSEECRVLVLRTRAGRELMLRRLRKGHRVVSTAAGPVLRELRALMKVVDAAWDSASGLVPNTRQPQ